MKAIRGNKEYVIDETSKQHYIDAGYDITENGKVVSYGRGKTVSYSDYAAVVEELNETKKRNSLTDSTDQEAIEILSEYAKEHDISLGRSTSLSGIVKKIKDAVSE